MCITSFLTSISFIASIFNNNYLFLCFLSLFIISSHLITCFTSIPYYHIHFITFYLIYLFHWNQFLVLLFLVFHNFFQISKPKFNQLIFNNNQNDCFFSFFSMRVFVIIILPSTLSITLENTPSWFVFIQLYWILICVLSLSIWLKIEVNDLNHCSNHDKWYGIPFLSQRKQYKDKEKKLIPIL